MIILAKMKIIIIIINTCLSLADLVALETELAALLTALAALAALCCCGVPDCCGIDIRGALLNANTCAARAAEARAFSIGGPAIIPEVGHAGPAL